MKTQFLTNDSGKKVAVVLPIEAYKKLMDELDELACVKAYDKSTSRKQEFIPIEDAFKTIEKSRKKR